MGKGIATQFRAKFPMMYLEYKSLCRRRAFRPGNYMPWRDEAGGPWVYNLFTQGYENSTIQPATLGAISQSVSEMLEHAREVGVTDIGLPRIGAGLGGLQWEEVEAELEEVLGNYPLTNLVIHTLAV